MAGKSRRGFAAMDEQRQREIASKGGRAAHERGTAHEFTPQEAREAGRRGGVAVSRDRAHMAEIGRRGGRHSHGGRNSARQQSLQANGSPTQAATAVQEGLPQAPAGNGHQDPLNN